MKLLTFIALLGMPPPASAQSPPDAAADAARPSYILPSILYGGSAAIDIAVTEYRHSLGGRELNRLPFMRSTEGRIAAETAAAVGLTLWDVHLQKKKSKWVWPLRIAGVGLNIAVVVVQPTEMRAETRKRSR